jgi:hypothetical protein
MTIFNRFTPEIKLEGCRIALPTSGSAPAIRVFHVLPSVYPVAFYGRVITAFAGLDRPTIELGVTGDTTRYMAKQSIDIANQQLLEGSNAELDADSYGGVLGFCTRMKNPLMEPASTYSYDILATFRVGSGTLSGYSAGEVEFVMAYIDAKGSNY